MNKQEGKSNAKSHSINMSCLNVRYPSTRQLGIRQFKLCGWVQHIPQLVISQGLTYPQSLKMASSSLLAIMF